MAVLTNCWYPLGGRHANGMARERGRYGKVLQQTPCYTQKSIQFDSSLTSFKLLLPPEYIIDLLALGQEDLPQGWLSWKAKWLFISHILYCLTEPQVLCVHTKWWGGKQTNPLRPLLLLWQLSPSLFHCSNSTTVCQRSVYSLHRCASDEIPRAAFWRSPIFTTDLVNAIFNLLEVERGVHAMLTSQFKSFPLGISGGLRKPRTQEVRWWEYWGYNPMLEAHSRHGLAIMLQSEGLDMSLPCALSILLCYMKTWPNTISSSIATMNNLGITQK